MGTSAFFIPRLLPCTPVFFSHLFLPSPHPMDEDDFAKRMTEIGELNKAPEGAPTPPKGGAGNAGSGGAAVGDLCNHLRVVHSRGSITHVTGGRGLVHPCIQLQAHPVALTETGFSQPLNRFDLDPTTLGRGFGGWRPTHHLIQHLGLTTVIGSCGLVSPRSSSRPTVPPERKRGVSVRVRVSHCSQSERSHSHAEVLYFPLP